MRLTRFRTWLPVALFAAWVVALGGPAHAGGPPHAPPRVTLRDVAKRLMCFNIQVPPEVLVKAHDAYLDRYAEQYRVLDQEFERSAEAESGRAVIRGVRAVRQNALARSQALAAGMRLLDGYVDELRASVAADQHAMLAAFLDDCQTLLIMSSLEGDWNRFGDTYPPDDIMTWLHSYVNVASLPADQRARLAEACAAHAGARRAAALALSRSVDAARLRGGAKADEVGVAGRMEQPDYTDSEASQKMARETWDGVSLVRDACALTAKELQPFILAQVEAWKALAPFVSSQERATMLNSFVSVLLCDRADVGHADDARVVVDSAIYGGGISIARTALAIPGLTDEQRERTRAVLHEWLGARGAALEKALLAAPNETGRTSSIQAIDALDQEYRRKLVEATGARWLATREAESVQPQASERSGQVTAPRRDELSLRPEDAAAFPLPSSDDGWRDLSWMDDWERHQRRSRGLPIEPQRDLIASGASAIRLTDTQRAVWTQLAQDLLEEWDTQVVPRVVAARQADKPETFRSTYADAWKCARDAWRRFCSSSGAALPGETGLRARLWAEAQRADSVASMSAISFRRGYEVVLPVVPAAIFSPRMEHEWQDIAASTLAASATGLVDRIESLSDSERVVRQPATRSIGEGASGDRSSVPSWPDAYRECMVAVGEAVAAVAQALPAEGRVAWHRSINELRNRLCYPSILAVLDALPADERATPLRQAVLAEQAAVDELGDLAFAILVGGTDPLESGPDDRFRANSLRQSRASVYIELARDRVYLATWRLAQQLPGEARSRLTYIGVVANLKRLGAPAPAAASNTRE